MTYRLCPRLRRGLDCYWCTPEWTWCHEFKRRRCVHTGDGYYYCKFGWHISQEDYEENHSTKRTRPTRYTDDARANKKHRTNDTRDAEEAETTKKERFDHQKKWIECQIYLIRLGFYDISHLPDEKLPHPSEIENAYSIAMDDNLSKEEKSRKQEAFRELMRIINGHEEDRQSDSSDEAY